MLILGIETSCDETAAAVLRDGRELLSNVINSQVDIHGRYGGVVPELASRNHVRNIGPVVDEALATAGVHLGQLDGLAVTVGPGLIGSLLVGLSFAKAVSYARKLPYVGVDHIDGHLQSIFLGPNPPAYPFVALIASGGHSSLLLCHAPDASRLIGRTRDDAAGEAFDKVAKVLGLEYPGGPAISRLAREGDRVAMTFPRSWLEPDSLDFSFSGVKTAVAQAVANLKAVGHPVPVPDVCAAFQESVADVLSAKAVRAALLHGVGTVVLAGGVAANPRLRELLAERAAAAGLRLCVTPPEFCTDNAAMIAMAGFRSFAARATHSLDLDVYSRSPLIP